jgi:hypothetical protein
MDLSVCIMNNKFVVECHIFPFMALAIYICVQTCAVCVHAHLQVMALLMNEKIVCPRTFVP